uniref:Tetraspanin n=1 Tax=Eptatretus burgeri TaxID=7764 RepID=A0A8C4NLE1_EPTBU
MGVFICGGRVHSRGGLFRIPVALWMWRHKSFSPLSPTVSLLTGCGVFVVGIWILVQKADYLSLLASSTFAATAIILIITGVVVMATAILGCFSVYKEHKGLLRLYFMLLLIIFLLVTIAGVLAFIYQQQLSDELKWHLNNIMVENYNQPGQESVTQSVDKLQQEFHCCGSVNSTDWERSLYVQSSSAEGRKVPDSCCKTKTERCGIRTHPSNIYREGGCITKLENFLSEHLFIIGVIGIGVALLQVMGMIFTCCLYRSIKSDPY